MSDTEVVADEENEDTDVVVDSPEMSEEDWLDLFNDGVGPAFDEGDNDSDIFVTPSNLSVAFIDAEGNKLCGVTTCIANKYDNIAAVVKKGFEVIEGSQGKGAFNNAALVVIPELGAEMSIKEARKVAEKYELNL